MTCFLVQLVHLHVQQKMSVSVVNLLYHNRNSAEWEEILEQ